MELEAGQVAVVTGGASGLGFALAEAFAARGLQLVIADVERGALDDAVARLEASGASAIGVPTDVRFAEALDELAAATLDRFGRVDVVCNNAGVSSFPAPMWEVAENDWRWVMSVNFDGVVNGVRAFVPHLVSQNSGHVVNTASMAGISVGPLHAPYLASKHAVVAVSAGLAMELAQAAPNVGVTVVCPGQVVTNIQAAERNRPVGLAVEARAFDFEDPGVAGFMRWMASITHDGMTADDAAAIVVQAVESNTLYVAPNGATEGVEAWIDGLRTDLSF